MMHLQPRYPLLTDGHAGDSEDDDNHALVVPNGNRVHPIGYIDSKLPGMPIQLRKSATHMMLSNSAIHGPIP
jgi:hypothetical protein